MAEIYRNSLQYITLDIIGANADSRPNALAMVGTQNMSLEVLNAPEIIEGNIERWTAVVGFQHTQNVGTIRVTWFFGIDDAPVQHVDEFEVVVPLLDTTDIRNELELSADVTNETIVMAERRVRKLIEAHCDQRFFPENKTVIVRGNGDVYMRLPERLISVTEIVDTRMAVPWVGYSITNDGWTLHRVDGYYYDSSTVTAPIYAPPQYGGYSRGWLEGVEWAITGRWGWETVPAQVSEAALILIEQRVCAQSAYRDNYMSSMKAADWRFDFFQEAVQGTGNVLADQLLAAYVRVGVGVI